MLRDSKRQVGDLPLLVEVGRLELLFICLLNRRSDGYRRSDLRF
jgi:hypothetical protein